MTQPAVKPKLERSGVLRMFQVLLLQVVEAAILFGAAGRLDWWAAWAYLGIRFAGFVIFGALVIRVNPEIINERGRIPKDTKSWDKLFGIFYLLLLIALPLMAGLDARFSWSDMAAFWRWVGVVAIFPAIILPYWAMLVNAYLTTTVRIQEERGHQVVTSGPYHYVRHPMYVGVILLALSEPLFLGSWWALIPGFLTVVVVLWRTNNEDKILHAELDGYVEYAQVVHYRLLPGIW